MSSKKQFKRFEVPFDFDWTYGVELKKLKEDIETLEKMGATHIDIEAYEYYGSTSIEIKAFVEREETDQEFKLRKAEEKRRAEQIRARELELLEKLKSKYSK